MKNEIMFFAVVDMTFQTKMSAYPKWESCFRSEAPPNILFVIFHLPSSSFEL